MMAVRVVWLAVLLIAIPFWVGHCFTDRKQKGAGQEIYYWISGQMALWAGFQVLCVPVILLEGRLEYVLAMWAVYTAGLSVAALVRYKKSGGRKLSVVRTDKVSREEKLLWGIFFALLAVQLVLAVVMTYADGDDAYYMVLSAAAENSGEMYEKLPYTGISTKLDIRHGLAPFPMWIAGLAKLTGIRTVLLGKTLLPLVLISMTYGVFYLIGSRELFRGDGKKVPLFLIITEVLVLFGDVSFYTVENFMIARSRQGKAALGSILIPMIFYLLLVLFRRLQEEQKIPVSFWMLSGMVMTSCCLASTMGAMLGCMLVGVAGICGAVAYRRWKILLPMAACCIPCLIYAGMYLVLG